jgi:hypothetical protein
MRARIPLVLACAALVAVSCQDTPTEPVEQPVATAPEYNFMNGPAFPGNSGMERFSSNETFNYTLDLDAPWLLVTYDPYEAYAGCTLDRPYLAPPWDIQEKQRETKAGIVTTRLYHGDLDVTLYDHFIWDTEYTSVCEFLVNDWLYKGTAKFVVHREWLDDLWYWNVASASGVVEDRDGNQYRLNYKERCCNGNSSDFIRIKVTPIGN